MATLLTAEQVLSQLNQEHVNEFITQFNDDMADPKYVESWRCGGEGESFWRFPIAKDHNTKTETEIRRLLEVAGWKVTNVARGFDRYHYTNYSVAKA